MNTRTTDLARPHWLPDMGSARSTAIACWLVPLLYGLYSLTLGADSNWDLRNYHLYNAFALLHGKRAIDLAPAGMQSYFNPLLDVPYYLMAMHLPAMAVGFIMGVMHGLNFVLLVAIGLRVFADLPESSRRRTAFWLALAGCFTANFMSGVGNSMGDNTTALFSLGALLIVLTIWPRIGQGRPHVLAAIALGGVVAGLGTGLKLTTAVYSAALCAGLLFAPVSTFARLRAAFVFGIGVLAGLAATGGFWLVEMGHAYGNPLYPQFSTLFPSALTANVGIADQHWFPKSASEALLFPFVFSAHPLRVGQVVLHQATWVIVYVVFWWWAASIALRRRVKIPALPSPARYVVAYVAIGYLLWLKMFSIQRYLVAIELCVPLVIYVLMCRLSPHRFARRATAVVLTINTAAVLIGGAHSWGHNRWASRIFSADVPTFEAPDRTTVVLTSGDPPLGWLVPMFPATVSFAAINSSFPQARPAFDNRLHEIVAKRGGPTYALLPGYRSGNEDDPAANAAERATSGRTLAEYGFALDEASCRVYRGRIGAGAYPFQWCRITLLR
ncbi:hypothetical protein C7405_107151 [Paraburkholderia caballeronis]|uniref:hypothetical protein n=1 Tax=Paraburkholderia caballeronis TaxID=416943 RepID=UPI0010F2BCE5|nr:hypothetical protein [Paraburkholderia caballeronis]TDV34752.1 hypothetical protein C7405_107151 [Paraburkholderia caballeronis]